MPFYLHWCHDRTLTEVGNFTRNQFHILEISSQFLLPGERTALKRASRHPARRRIDPVMVWMISILVGEQCGVPKTKS